MLQMTYQEFVRHLLEKYGTASHDYFIDESYEHRNPKVARTDEGLVCHHIDEDKICNLSSKIVAKNFTFDYQKADRLVYCTLLGHLLLHTKIFEERLQRGDDFDYLYGIGGILGYICPEINDFYGSGLSRSKWQRNVHERIKDSFDYYIIVLKYILNYAKKHQVFRDYVTAEALSLNMTGHTVERVYERLIK